MNCHSSTSQTTTRPSEPPTAAVIPSGEKTPTSTGPTSQLYADTVEPPAVSIICTPPTTSAQSSSRPPGERASGVSSGGNGRVATGSPIDRSQRQTSPGIAESSEPPSGEKLSTEA